MKKVQAIIRPNKLEALKDAAAQAGYRGMTVTSVHGCGNQGGWKEYFRGAEIFVNMQPKMQCEFVVKDEDVQGVVDMIIETCRTGEVGDGKVFIIPVETAIRIRTGETGDAAI